MACRAHRQLPCLLGQQPKSARTEFYYFNDAAELVAIRYDTPPGSAWKVIFCEQRQPGQFDIWANPFTGLRAPRIFNLRIDPFEHAQISGDGYDAWRADNAYLVFEGVRRAAGFLETFVEHPPSQPPATFSVDQVVEDVKKKIEQQMQKR